MHRFLFFIIVVIVASCVSSCSIKNKIIKEEIPLLIITDFGRDVDDAQAFAYIAEIITGKESGLLNIFNKKFSPDSLTKLPHIAGVITTGYIPQIRAKSLELFLNLYNLNVPIAVVEGEKSYREIEEYFATHKIDGKPYEITLLERLGDYAANLEMWRDMQDSLYCNKYLSPDNLIDSLRKVHGGNLRVMVLAQATQLAKYLDKYRDNKPLFDMVIIQGQCDSTLDGKIKPNFEAYNLREDSLAAHKIFELQASSPFLFVTKYDTYPYAFTKAETDSIGRCSDIGDYLKASAYMGLQSFLERDSVLFYKIFKLDSAIPAHAALDSLKVCNNPYDLLGVVRGIVF